MQRTQLPMAPATGSTDWPHNRHAADPFSAGCTQGERFHIIPAPFFVSLLC
jgi:hypothetical protein